MCWRLLNRPVAGRPLYVWTLWALAAAVLVSCPMLLSEPAMWTYLLDPELLALVVVAGASYTRLEIGVQWLALRNRFGRPAGTAVR